MEYARHLLTETTGRRAIDIGCGAGRNSVPLADLGWEVLGIDLSRPMLDAARARARARSVRGSLALALAPMHALPVPDAACDLIVAHGIWNLARSSAEFRSAVREAARAASNDAALFVFTFSRHTLPATAEPVPGESFVFTQFSGGPQCFLTDAELLGELADAGFRPDPFLPIREHNRPAPGALTTVSGPVIYEAAFRLRKAAR
jgi:SAM-dependent methyltransferase